MRKYFAGIPLIVWSTLFIGCPLLYILILSFMTRGATGSVIYEFTFENYIRIFDPLYLKIFWRSMNIAGFTALLTLLIGYPFAYILSALPKQKKSAFLLLLMIPFWTNSLLRTYGWMILLRRDGVVNTLLMALSVINQPLSLMYHYGTVMTGMVYMLLPFMILPLYNAIEKLDYSLIEASRDLGAGRVKTFLSITVPMTLSGIISGIMLVFILAVGLFFISDLLGGAKTMLLGNLIQDQMTSARDWPFGAALSVVMALGVLLFLLLYTVINKKTGNKGGLL